MKHRTTNLSLALEHRLSTYATAASAAGVGILALAQPAEAKIVYTPANIPIVQNGGPVELDLNHDGINDFQFSFAYATEEMRPLEGFHQSSLTVYPVQPSNRVHATESKGRFEAAALPKGKSVGPHELFQPGQSAMSMWACAGGTSGGGCGGQWLKVKQAYLGLKFVIKGKTHFGWTHIRNAGETYPTIVGYAYETVPNKSIITGETKGPDTGQGSLGALAAGAAGR